MPDAVALCHSSSYANPALRHKVFEVLNSSGIQAPPGTKILVKPNLLMANHLSCTNAHIVAAVCEWLQGRSAKVSVADSPAFGSCEGVAKAIGLTEALAPLGIVPRHFSASRVLKLDAPGSPSLKVAREALESDMIISVAKVKAHSQVGITLAVKNCFGCIMGVQKALAHVRFGSSLDYFTDCVASLWASLPPVAAMCDGVVAMNFTGPRFGKPFPLGLVGASMFAPALDQAILDVLKLGDAPLSAALRRRGVEPECCYPLERPEEFDAKGFEIPRQLKEISFSPIVLLRSIARRMYHSWKN